MYIFVDIPSRHFSFVSPFRRGPPSPRPLCGGPPGHRQVPPLQHRRSRGKAGSTSKGCDSNVLRGQFRFLGAGNGPNNNSFNPGAEIEFDPKFFKSCIEPCFTHKGCQTSCIRNECFVQAWGCVNDYPLGGFQVGGARLKLPGVPGRPKFSGGNFRPGGGYGGGNQTAPPICNPI